MERVCGRETKLMAEVRVTMRVLVWVSGDALSACSFGRLDARFLNQTCHCVRVHFYDIRFESR